MPYSPTVAEVNTQKNICMFPLPRVAEVVRRHEGPLKKSLKKSLSPNIGYFVAISRFVAIYTLFGKLWQKNALLGSKTVFLGLEVHYYMVYIVY